MRTRVKRTYRSRSSRARARSRSQSHGMSARHNCTRAPSCAATIKARPPPWLIPPHRQLRWIDFRLQSHNVQSAQAMRDNTAINVRLRTFDAARNILCALHTRMDVWRVRGVAMDIQADCDRIDVQTFGPGRRIPQRIPGKPQKPRISAFFRGIRHCKPGINSLIV